MPSRTVSELIILKSFSRYSVSLVTGFSMRSRLRSFFRAARGARDSSEVIWLPPSLSTSTFGTLESASKPPVNLLSLISSSRRFGRSGIPSTETSPTPIADKVSRLTRPSRPANFCDLQRLSRFSSLTSSRSRTPIIRRTASSMSTVKCAGGPVVGYVLLKHFQPFFEKRSRHQPDPANLRDSSRSPPIHPVSTPACAQVRRPPPSHFFRA
mmetsp:Transcript_12751/g.39124  ORF Transcript_12751/g.39124 Transcript_12751/m.39124 type:complete len:211 (-) Transcript_12751:272-904(-)